MVFNVIFDYGDKIIQLKYKASTKEALIEHFKLEGYTTYPTNRYDLASSSLGVKIYPEIIETGV